MLLRIATAVGIALALAGVVYAISGYAKRSPKPTLVAAIRVGCMALGASAWLALASTALIWIFPLNIAASALIGYLATRSVKHAFPVLEVKAGVGLSAACGVAIAAAIATAGDPFMLQVAAPYSLLNAIAMAGSSYLASRPVPSEA